MITEQAKYVSGYCRCCKHPVNVVEEYTNGKYNYDEKSHCPKCGYHIYNSRLIDNEVGEDKHELVDDVNLNAIIACLMDNDIKKSEIKISKKSYQHYLDNCGVSIEETPEELIFRFHS